MALPAVAAFGVLMLLANLALNEANQGNATDVWTDNIGQPAGPGHEQDPHLQCQDINLWGNGLAETSGTFTIDSWSPTGNRAAAYGSASWTYDESAGGTQVIAVIPIAALLAGSKANGDVAQAQQGLHFKLQLAQDPQKHKTFWVNCASTSPTSSGSPTPTPSESPSPSPTQSTNPSPSHSPSPPISTSPSPTVPPGTLPNTGGGPFNGPAGTLSLISLLVFLLGSALVIGGRLLRR